MPFAQRISVTLRISPLFAGSAAAAMLAWATAPRSAAAQAAGRGGAASSTAAASSETAADETVDDDLRELDVPMGVRFKLADGATITGVLSAWSDDGILGSFGYRRWSDIRPSDARDLFQRLMDAGDPKAWVRLGRMLLCTPGGAGLAEQAFRKARALDGGIGEAIEAARRDAAACLSSGTEPDAARLRLAEPESHPWSATPWLPLSAGERDSAVEILKQDAEAVLAMAGMGPIRPVESDHLLVYWDRPREDAVRLALRLERAIASLDDALRVGGSEPVFWGKALVIVTSDRAIFRALQQRVFLQLDRPQRTAMCHCIGAKVVVIAFGGSGGDDLVARLVRELTFGVLHRHISPRRLPPWANEGMAEMAAAKAAPELFELESRRRAALRALRGGTDVAVLYGAAYGEPSWPGPPADASPTALPVGPAMGRLAVEAMVAERPAAMASWIAAVKRGTDWREALHAAFGVTPARLAQVIVERHRHAD